jgi:hypothetical protein
VEELALLVSQLSQYRRALCKEIFFVLYLVSRESDINLMDSMNLATIFGKLNFPSTLFLIGSGGMVNIVSDSLFADEKKRLCCLLIEYYPQIFCPVDVLVKLPQVELTEEQKEAKVGN